jgi:hypothetical protein
MTTLRVTGAVLLLAAAAGAAAAQTPQPPRRIGLGESRDGELSASDPVTRSRRAPYQVWTLEGRRGQRVVIDMTSADFDSYLMLRDADGMNLATDDDGGDGTNARIRTSLPRDGTYRIVATAFSADGRGRYALAVSGWQAPGPGPGTVTPIAFGQSLEGVLEPGDSVSIDGPLEDRWTFEAPANGRVRVEMRSGDFDAYLIVLSPDGRQLASDDDGLGDRDAVVSVRTPQAGRYTILATSFGENQVSGSYRLDLIDDAGNYADPGRKANIATGETREGRLEEGDNSGTRGWQDEWAFSGRAGQVVRVDVTSRQFDPYITLLRDGVPVDSNDDGGEGTNARLTTTLPGAGLYTLVVSSYTQNRTGGRYQVALSLTAAPAGPGQAARIAPGQTATGRLEAGDRPRGDGGYEDYFEFDGRAGQHVNVEMRADGFDAFLELRDGRGTLIAENDDGLGEGTNAYILASLPSNGRYRIVARSFGEESATGLYEVALALAGAPAAPGRPVDARPGDFVVGRLEPGDSVLGDSTYADVIVFRPDRAGEITIDMHGGEFDAFLLVKDATGRTLGTDDDGGPGRDARVTMRVSAGQTYRIYANSYGEERVSGTYRVSLRWSP